MMKTVKKKIWVSLLSSPNSYISRKVLYLAHEVEQLRWQEQLQKAQIHDVDKIFTYTRQAELRTLYTLASNCPQNTLALEIGSHFGASSCYIAAGLAQIGGHLFCVDTWNNETMIEGEQDTFSQFKENTKGVQQWITPIRKWSSHLNENDIQCPLNFVFIDGDHRYEAVKNDFRIVKEWLADDGIIAFHDFDNPDYEGISRVVGEALASGEWVLSGKVDTLAWIKRAQWSQPSWLSKVEASVI